MPQKKIFLSIENILFTFCLLKYHVYSWLSILLLKENQVRIFIVES